MFCAKAGAKKGRFALFHSNISMYTSQTVVSLVIVFNFFKFKQTNLK